MNWLFFSFVLFFIKLFSERIWFVLNKIKTPNFTFLGVKLGVCFIICWFSAFIAEREGTELFFLFHWYSEYFKMLFYTWSQILTTAKHNFFSHTDYLFSFICQTPFLIFWPCFLILQTVLPLFLSDNLLSKVSILPYILTSLSQLVCDNFPYAQDPMDDILHQIHESSL